MLLRRLPLPLTCIVAFTLAACDESKQKPSPMPGASASAASATAPASAAAPKPLPPMPKAAPIPKGPEVLPEVKSPPENALTPEKVALGRQLFFDKRLSKDGTASCETCHVPEKGWTDGSALSKKVGGAVNTRHSPTLINVAYNQRWYWDGRAETLEKQIEAAWKGQMGADPAAIAATVGKIPGYEVQFKTIFNRDATGDDIVAALASFVRTIRSGDAPWDLYEKGDKKAVSEEAVRGAELFRGKAQCMSCHTPPLYTDLGFHNVGIGFDKPEPDLGRGKISKDEKENGAFKTPSLRSVSTHAPYFHDGRAATLDEAVDYMLSGGVRDKNANIDPRFQKVKLTPKERTDSIAFLKALEPTASAFERPALPQ
ncbi:MAG: cytochrome c peroxidase [Minicystis sp.]